MSLASLDIDLGFSHLGNSPFFLNPYLSAGRLPNIPICRAGGGMMPSKAISFLSISSFYTPYPEASSGAISYPFEIAWFCPHLLCCSVTPTINRPHLSRSGEVEAV